MDDAQANHSPMPHLRRFQLITSLAVVGVVLATCVTVDILARRDEVAYERQRRQRWRQINGKYQPTQGFADFEDRLLLDELPWTDFSGGGVCYIGSSNVKVSVMPWRLPPAMRDHVRNYAISAATHYQQYQFIRYLTEHEGLLAAGGDKTMVVVGLFYGSAVRMENRYNATYFADLFGRHGLYNYSRADGISPAPMMPEAKFVRIEKVRCRRFLNRWLDRLTVTSAGIGLAAPDLRVPESKTPDAQAYQAFWQGYMGESWQEEMAEQIECLGRMIDYLHARGVSVVAVFTPLGSWHQALPYLHAYRDQATALLRAKDVDVVDLTTFLADDEFCDSSHANHAGQQKLHEAMVAIAGEHLMAIGAVVASGPGVP